MLSTSTYAAGIVEAIAESVPMVLATILASPTVLLPRPEKELESRVLVACFAESVQ